MVSQKKQKDVEELVSLIDKYPVIGVLDMKFLPSAQLQEIRNRLRGEALIKMYRKNVIIRALEKTKKKGISRLKEKIGEIPALIFSESNPFKLLKKLKESRSFARAKVGDVLSKDVEVRAGPTNIAAGPAIGQLQKLGLKTTVKDGKINIEESMVVAKTGDVVTKEMADVFALLDVKPVEIGLNMTAAYEAGMIYDKEILSIDEEYVLNLLKEAASNAFALSVNLNIPTKENITYLLTQASSNAEKLSLLVKKEKEEEK